MEEKRSEETSRSVSQEITIQAPVEDVWKALTDAEELTRWFPLEAKTKPGAGGSVWMSWRNEYEFTSAIKIWEPKKRLKLVNESFPTEDNKSGVLGQTSEAEAVSFPTAVAMDYHLESQGNRTILRLVHSGFSQDAEWDNLFDAVSRGWDYQFWSLRHYLENHLGKPRGMVYQRHFINSYSLQSAWDRIWSTEGIGGGTAPDDLKPGADYSFETQNGIVLQGEVRTFEPPSDFLATVENYNNGIMRLQLEDLYGKKAVSMSISTYGLPDQEVEDLRSKCQDFLNRLLPEVPSE
jgi:uncharacterized protein YndB with AHSA1/START domain